MPTATRYPIDAIPGVTDVAIEPKPSSVVAADPLITSIRSMSFGLMLLSGFGEMLPPMPEVPANRDHQPWRQKYALSALRFGILTRITAMEQRRSSPTTRESRLHPSISSPVTPGRARNPLQIL